MNSIDINRIIEKSVSKEKQEIGALFNEIFAEAKKKK